MGDVVGDLLDAAHQLLDPLQHRVQVLRELIPFVLGAPDGNALAQTACHDGVAGRVHCLDPRHGAARDRDTGRGGQQTEERDAQGKPAIDRAGEGGHVVDILAGEQMAAVGQGRDHGAQQWAVLGVGPPVRWREFDPAVPRPGSCRPVL